MVSEKRHGLGSEHPLCDRIQLIMIILFLVVWGTDSLSFFIFGYSTVLINIISFPALLLPSFASLGFGLYLIAKSHKAVFGEAHVHSKLIDSGVYSWVRHPMYLGILLFCLAFFFVSPSMLSLGILVVFFIFYNKMATYEEKSLLQILGEEYVAYKKRVPKWFPKLFSRS
ncbi:MAG TPA: isoprenylcysteine carboxylmethyltransferase family protein [Candidatus Bathyarchaeota archaeon]|nr:isoprenylcysteine carboxylmethyltransferase family protein [Candidatus Bathyarchaeota archaeon]